MPKILHKNFLILLGLVTQMSFFSQTGKADITITKPGSDSLKIRELIQLSYEMEQKNPKKAALLCETAYNLARAIGWNRGMILGVLRQATIYNNVGEYKRSRIAGEKVLEITEKLLASGDNEISKEDLLEKKCWALMNSGIISVKGGFYMEALSNYLQAQKIASELKLQREMAEIKINIGVVYAAIKETDKALKYYLEAAGILNAINDQKYMAELYGNIGNLYFEKRKFDKAEKYYLAAFEMDKFSNNILNLQYDFGYLGCVYFEKAMELRKVNRAGANRFILKAEDFYLQALKLSEELHDRRLVANWRGSLGNLYFESKKYGPAEKYLLESVELSSSLGLMNEQMQFEKILCELYRIQRKNGPALFHFTKYTELKDSLFNVSKSQEFARIEMRHEYELKAETAKKDQEKKDALAQASSKKQEMKFWLLFAAFSSLLLFLALIYRTLRVTRHQKRIIEIKNNEISEKNKNIVASLEYALKIQQSLLPSEKLIEKQIGRLREKTLKREIFILPEAG